MTPRIKTGLTYALTLAAVLAGISGAGVLSVYASRVSSSITMETLSASTGMREKTGAVNQIRKRNVLEEFSAKNRKFILVKQEYSGTSVFLYVLTDSGGKQTDTIVVKKTGISAFAPYIGDSMPRIDAGSSQRNQNPVFNALNVRTQALRQLIESDIPDARRADR